MRAGKPPEGLWRWRTRLDLRDALNSFGEDGKKERAAEHQPPD
jgi:hypothetical protein